MTTKEQAKARITPIVMEILEEQCPWVFLQDEKEPRDGKMFQDDHLYSTKELAGKLGVTVKTLHNRMNRKTDNDSIFKGLPSRMIGRTRMYEGRDLNAWWDSIQEVQ